jgi:glycosyltransferase involved in cell wall biosynthesis
MTTQVDIAYVIPRPEIGGAERQLLMLLEGLDRSRFRPHVFCLDGEGSLFTQFAGTCDSIHVIGRKHTIDLLALVRLIRLVRDIRPTIVHTWLHISNVYGGWAARLAGAPWVIASHRGLAKDPRHGLLTECQKRILNFFVSQFADKLVTNAQAVAQRMVSQGFRTHDTTVIYNGLRTPDLSETELEQVRMSLHLDGQEILLGTISRIDPKKNLETMLEAVALVTHTLPQVRLLVVGGGSQDYQCRLEALAGSLGIASNVRFLGFRQDPLAIMSLCEVSLLSSVTEGLPNAILESMMLGKPVVATEVGGVPELITDGVEGFLVRPGDHQAFAARILCLLRDPTLARRMGDRGYAKAVDAFTPNAMLHNTQAVYLKLVAEMGGDLAGSTSAAPPRATKVGNLDASLLAPASRR